MRNGLPSREAVLDFIRESEMEVGKREIARAFGVKGADRVELKIMLADMAREGLIEKGGRRKLHEGGRLPPVGVIEVTRINADGEPVAIPQTWDGEGAAPLIILAAPKRGEPAPGVGDRVLAKLRPLPRGDDYAYEARIIKVLGAARKALGVFRESPGGGGRVVPVEKKADKDYQVDASNRNDAEDGELVEIETVKGPRFGLPRARIIARLGDVSAPRAISLIAIHEHGIPVDFDPAAEKAAQAAKPLESLKGREDLRDLPLVTIDPEDARDHDDAVYAQLDDDPANPGGFILWVAIADVAHYVRPGSALDLEARRRGNSCYFPDRVVPMLPDRLSGDLCSLHEGESRPCMALRIVLGAKGEKREHRFMRGIMRSAASLTYEQAQAAENGAPEGKAETLLESVVKPLFACYRALMQAREKRQPLDLDLPERRVMLNEAGQVASIRLRDRFDAHKLIEECMVLANVCAAETLEQKRTPLLYRVHEPPIEDRVEALRETLETIGVAMAKGQRMTPSHINRALGQAAETAHAETVNMAVLRAQTQAYYSPDNLGHFGLNLARYAHFTSPIRRYADLIVHRALVSALGLGAEPAKDGLSPEEAQVLEDTAKHISQTERRAMMAERDSTDRYLAAYMEDRLGAEFDGIISGVARFGVFVKLDHTGADGLVPISSIGDDFYHHDERANTLTGARTRHVLRLGQRVRVRLEEAAPLTGGLRFSLLEGGVTRGGGGKTKPAMKGARKAAIKKAKALKKAKRSRK